ncbi:MAG: substrate-binding domain-containing protein [Halofilum sp. (in: g-proteobacteria)]|nr:substrate-binding domain-containing protein [Halofilum sp. (in: g-proteobacteria)]
MRNIALALAVSGSMLPAAAMAQETVTADGSSTVFPITEALAEEFQIETRVPHDGRASPARVAVSAASAVARPDISGASRPITYGRAPEAAASHGIEYYEIPVAMDAMAVMVHPSNDWVDHLTVEELRRPSGKPEAEGEITNWSQVRDGFPDRELSLVRSRDRLRHV